MSRRRRCVVFAPNHADIDSRVVRTAALFADVFDHVDVYWDADYPGHRRPPTPDNVVNHYVTPPSADHGLVAQLRRGRRLVGDLAVKLGKDDLLYIHGSGIEGLVFAQAAKRSASAVPVVFDYHDSLPFELSYQLEKRGLGWLYRSAWRAYRPVLERLGRHLDAVVGISERQIHQLFGFVGRELPYAVVPNLRDFDDAPPRQVAGASQTPLQLLWVGQVMKGRDLERVATLAKAVTEPWELHVFGNILDEDARRAVEALCGGRATFHGPYRGDQGLRRALPDRSIAVFLGWEDRKNTGINEIASPNKFYSYVNLEVPIIVGDRLKSLAEDVAQHGAGQVVCGPQDFASAVVTLNNNYGEFSMGARRLKTSYRSIDLPDRLNRLVDSLYRGQNAAPS